MELDEKLKALRTASGMTQEQLAAKLYVSRTAISKWETGGGYPNLDSLQSLARTFNVSVDELLSGDDLIDLARDERQVESRKGFLLFAGLLDVFAAAFVLLPLFSLVDGSYIRSVPLAEYGAGNNYGLSFVLIAGVEVSLFVVGAMEVWAARQDSGRVGRGAPAAGFAVGLFGMLVFLATREVYAAALLLVILVAKTLITVRFLRSVSPSSRML